MGFTQSQVLIKDKCIISLGDVYDQDREMDIDDMKHYTYFKFDNWRSINV